MERQTIGQALRRALNQLLWNYSRWLLLVLLIAYGASGIYKIDRDSVGVLSRFGKVVGPAVPPGLHYKLPWPVDRVDLVQIKQVKTIVINDFGSRYKLKEGGGAYEYYKNTNLEPYCITGDNNIVAVSLVVKYTIDNPVQYLYEVRQAEYLVERSAAGLIVEHLADLRIDDVLTSGKKQLEFDLQRSLAERLESYRVGIRVSFLEIKEIAPPEKVQEAFDRVINAEVNKKKALHQAQGYYNRTVPEARSDADQLVQEARAYKREKILKAEGEASRFLSQYEAYSANPQAQRDRLQLDFIGSLYPKLGEIRVVDSPADNGAGGMLPERLLLPR